MSKKCLPAWLQTRHTDWIRGLKWVPRWWTARCGWFWPAPPARLLGRSGWTMQDYLDGLHNHHPHDYYRKIKEVLPIPAPGHWMITAVLWAHFLPLPMFAWKFRNGDYVSVGIARWDDVDNYYDLMRVRAHGTKGRIALAGIGAGIAALTYFLIWPFILERILAWALRSL